jgi:DNA replication initiation complex subunit (GINS family)
MSKLPDEFYPKLRRLISELENEPNKGSERILEQEKTRHLARDIVNSRLRKIISIASAPAQTEQTLKNLTGEERFLYGRLYRFINEWRTQILEERSVEE